MAVTCVTSKALPSTRRGAQPHDRTFSARNHEIFAAARPSDLWRFKDACPIYDAADEERPRRRRAVALCSARSSPLSDASRTVSPGAGLGSAARRRDLGRGPGHGHRRRREDLRVSSRRAADRRARSLRQDPQDVGREVVRVAARHPHRSIRQPVDHRRPGAKRHRPAGVQVQPRRPAADDARHQGRARRRPRHVRRSVRRRRRRQRRHLRGRRPSEFARS